jgi:hypothetical protein
MYVIVEHRVSDPATFFSIAQQAKLPAELKLHQVIPSEDGSRCVCLWEADSPRAVQDFIEPAIGHVSKNEYFAVDAAHAVGIPGAASQAAGQAV